MPVFRTNLKYRLGIIGRYEMKQAVFKKALCMGIVMIAALLLSAGIIPAASNQPQTAISNPSTLTSSSPDLVITDIGNEGTKSYYEINPNIYIL